MNQEQVVRIAVKAAADWWEEKQKQELADKADRRLHNTRLLLQNYWAFKKHCEKSIYKLSQVVDHAAALGILDIIDKYDDKAYISTIKQNAVQTHVIMAHVDTMLEVYRQRCHDPAASKPEDQRKFRSLCRYYMDGVKMEDIAVEETVDPATVSRDIKDACETLGALIFGVHGV